MVSTQHYSEGLQSPPSGAWAQRLFSAFRRMLSLREKVSLPVLASPPAVQLLASPDTLLLAEPRAFAPVTPLQRTNPSDPTPERPRFHAPDLDPASVVFTLTAASAPLPACLDWLGEHGLRFRRLASLQTTSPIWSAPTGALVLVDVEQMGGIATLAQPLMRLRLLRPDLVVVLLSDEFASHDFSLERLPVADVSLRLPCSYASFEFALVEAPVNNGVWQDRLAAMGRVA